MTAQRDLEKIVFNHSPCGILALDSQEKITFLNPTLCQWIGISPEELIGHDQTDIPTSFHRDLFKGDGLLNIRHPGIDNNRWLECVSHTDNEGGRISFFTDVTSQIELQKENERLTKQVQQLTLTDELTGLANQLELSRALSAQVTRSRRYGNPLSLAMVEVVEIHDAEKVVSDELILATSRYLRDRLRWVDVIARWGHNQFVIVLPETNYTDSHALISKIQESFAETQVSEREDEISLAMNVGIAEWKKGFDAHRLMRQASASLTGNQDQIEQASVG